MTARLVRIENAGPDMKARRLVFDDETTRMTSAAAVKTLALGESDNPLADVVEEALAGVEPQLAKDHALRLLGFRERSTAELSRRLLDAGYPAAVTRPVLDRFRELDLVNDERFARVWASSRAAAGYGRRRVAQELTQKGVDAGTVRTVLDAAFDADAQVDLARAALRGARPSTRAERERLLRRLVSRGFDMSSARAAIDMSDPDVQGDASSAD